MVDKNIRRGSDLKNHDWQSRSTKSGWERGGGEKHSGFFFLYFLHRLAKPKWFAHALKGNAPLTSCKTFLRELAAIILKNTKTGGSDEDNKRRPKWLGTVRQTLCKKLRELRWSGPGVG